MPPPSSACPKCRRPSRLRWFRDRYDREQIARGEFVVQCSLPDCGHLYVVRRTEEERAEGVPVQWSGE